MRNVTISLDEETALWARTEAARHDTSVSRFVGDVLRRQMHDDADYARALSSYASRPPRPISAGRTAYPSRDEIHER